MRFPGSNPGLTRGRQIISMRIEMPSVRTVEVKQYCIVLYCIALYYIALN